MSHHGKRTNDNRFVDWEEYLTLTPAEKTHVTVVTFTGLTDCATLKEVASAKGTLGVVREGEDPESPKAS